MLRKRPDYLSFATVGELSSIVWLDYQRVCRAMNEILGEIYLRIIALLGVGYFFSVAKGGENFRFGDVLFSFRL
ncbi:MAG: hypothetical protein ACT4OT_10945 [Acidobacteriota bacterium]